MISHTLIFAVTVEARLFVLGLLLMLTTLYLAQHTQNQLDPVPLKPK